MLRKKSRINHFLVVAVICFIILIPATLLEASHSKFLGTVPMTTQEAFIWCGPATAQMIMGGYPSGSCTVLQEDIWVEILTKKVDPLWDTDPVGIEKAMETLCHPTYGWVVKTKNTAGEMMYAVAKNINQYSYPVALVMNTDAHNINVPSHEEHWVAVTGIVTDVDPVANSSATLEGVLIHDPAYADLGYPSINRYCTASQWGTLFKAVNKPGSIYHNKYVAVMEPPAIRGILRIPREVLRGRIIKPELAQENAKKWLRKYNLFEIKAFKKLERAKPLTPMLVNRRYGGYYLVPFVLENGERMACGSVLINAYTGKLKEVGVFKSTFVMDKRKALRAALEYLGIKKKVKVKAEMVTKIKGRTFNPYFPAWKFTVNGKMIHVDMKGKVFSRFLPKIKKEPLRRRPIQKFKGKR